MVFLRPFHLNLCSISSSRAYLSVNLFLETTNKANVLYPLVDNSHRQGSSLKLAVAAMSRSQDARFPSLLAVTCGGFVVTTPLRLGWAGRRTLRLQNSESSEDVDHTFHEKIERERELPRRTPSRWHDDLCCSCRYCCGCRYYRKITKSDPAWQTLLHLEQYK